jgi:hypothetical protein
MQEYVLEVQRAVDSGETTYLHVGYMAKLFRSKPQAAAFYAEHNPHMPAIAAGTQWRSAKDPRYHTRCVVRAFANEVLTVPDFGILEDEQHLAANQSDAFGDE